MKRLPSSLLAALLALSLAVNAAEDRKKPRKAKTQTTQTTQPAEPKEQKEVTVYVTKTGEKYHLKSCQYLRRSAITMTLDHVKGRYAPCSRCNPPK